ncbi:ATPase, AFG1 family, partial [hydrothermal vent metagenome]
MTILENYNKQIKFNGFEADLAQQNTVECLAKLQQRLITHLNSQQTFRYKLTSFLKRPQPVLQGCYIWGGVGRGKTWLMDMFFESFGKHSPINNKKIRLHFHHFMAFIHDQLSLIDEQKKPLKHIAKSFAQHYQLLCLDEFHVSDITDAMLLHGLLETLLKEGVVIVITSNQAPDNLYKNGLQRDRFLPAIELIKQHHQIIHLEGNTDHRLRLLKKADTWYPVSKNSDKLLEMRYLELITCRATPNFKIHINYRIIDTILYTNDIIWFEFIVICGNKRGSADYIEIAKQFHSVFISHIPQMDDTHND